MYDNNTRIDSWLVFIVVDVVDVPNLKLPLNVIISKRQHISSLLDLPGVYKNINEHQIENKNMELLVA
jgi:hypothetical protein